LSSKRFDTGAPGAADDASLKRNIEVPPHGNAEPAETKRTSKAILLAQITVRDIGPSRTFPRRRSCNARHPGPRNAQRGRDLVATPLVFRSDPGAQSVRRISSTR